MEINQLTESEQIIVKLLSGTLDFRGFAKIVELKEFGINMDVKN